MEFVKMFGGIMLFSIIVLILYSVLKYFVLSKIKINRWAILILAGVEFVVPSLLWRDMPVFVSRYVIPGIFVILFLWFWDLSGRLKSGNTVATVQANRKNKKEDIVIRPKAKPNRVKNKEDK